MNTPSPTWSAVYRADRRNHHHRCMKCNRIIKDGEDVLMVRLRINKTKAVHAACSTLSFFPDGDPASVWSVADSMTAWGTAYLIGCGYKLPRHPMMSVTSELICAPAQEAA